MARDAFYFLVPIGLLALLAFWLGWIWPGAVLAALGAFIAFFFRDPDREVPLHPGTILSPADGKLLQVKRTEQGVRLSIFLSVFNVHVNRAPIAGTLVRSEHRPGRFLLAFDERASVENEQVLMRIEGEEASVDFALIAGLVARRIIPWKKVGTKLEKGERIALIRFGSRADVWIPQGFEVQAAPGDAVRAGTTVLAVRKDGA